MDSITFQVGTAANHDEIIEFLNLHFLPKEPMNISIGLLEPGYRIPYFDRMVRDHLRDEGTLVVLARERKVLMGLVMFITENNREETELEKEETDLICPRKLREIFNFIEVMRSHLDVGSLFGVSQWADLEFLVCHSQRRLPGLGTELVRIGTNMLADTGTKVVTVHASSHFSSQIFRKLGFQQIFSLPFREYEVGGQIVFPTASPHTEAALFVKRLKN